MVVALYSSSCYLKELTHGISSYFGDKFIVRLKKTWRKVKDGEDEHELQTS